MAKKATSIPMAPKTDAARERLWRAQSAVSTLQDAARIRADTKLMADARALAAQQAKALKAITNKR